MLRPQRQGSNPRAFSLKLSGLAHWAPFLQALDSDAASALPGLQCSFPKPAGTRSSLPVSSSGLRDSGCMGKLSFKTHFSLKAVSHQSVRRF